MNLTPNMRYWLGELLETLDDEVCVVPAGTGEALVRRGLAKNEGNVLMLTSGRRFDSTMMRGGILGWRTRAAYTITDAGRELAVTL